MLRESEVREKLVDVLQGDLSLEDLSDWLSSARRNMHLDSLPAAQELAGSVSLVLYEFFEGYLSESEALSDLRGFVNDVLVSIELTPARVATRSIANSQQTAVPLTL